MIIDKVKPYWTEEDYALLDEIHARVDAITKRLAPMPRQADGTPDPADLFANGEEEQIRTLYTEWQELDDKERDLYKRVEDRYLHARTKKSLLADIQDIVSATTKDEYLSVVSRNKQLYAELLDSYGEDAPAEGTNETLEFVKERARETYKNCCNWVLQLIRVQLNGLEENEDTRDKVGSIIEKQVSRWYEKPQPDYLPMVHGKPTDALAFMNSRNILAEKITGNATIKKFETTLVIEGYEQLQARLGISTDKLLSYATAIFTAQNTFGTAKGLRREVIIDLKDYATKLGYDVTEHETSTPQEAEKEKRRAKYELDNARKQIKKDLAMLYASSLSWQETTRGQARDFMDIRLIYGKGIVNGKIYITFVPELAEYLITKPLTQYPVKLLAVDNRKQTAYYIGRKLTEHWYMDNNQIKGTHDRISIPALLAVTDLPSFDYILQTDKWHWEDRIKEPLERALDELTAQGVLTDWKYNHAKGIDLTDEEAQNITSYDVFAGLYLRFTLAHPVDQTERIEAKQERKAETGKKRTRKKA